MTFSQIHGHDRQKDILRRALASGRLAHAYLFEGPEGVGKRLMALALVRALFCLEETGCGTCTACRKVDHGNHPDLYLVEPDGASIKIEQVRALQRELAFRPLEAQWKVCLVNGAEKLNPAAGNALLKTLEEPSPRALLILLTPLPENVLGTIRSRCQRLPFARIARREIEKLLRERLALDERQGHVLAALSDGSFDRALGRDREFFLERRQDLLKSLTALSRASVIPCLELAKTLADDKDRLPDVLEMFQAFYRDLLLFHHGTDPEELVNVDLLEKIRRVAVREDVPSLLRKLDALSACQRQLGRNVNRQLALEVLLLRLAA